jgi:hypothetical protein
MGFDPRLSDDGSFDAGRAYTMTAAGHGATNDVGLLVLEDTPTGATSA